MCLAALWKLPVVFVVENNGYAMGTPTYRNFATPDASVRALGYPMARATLEGVDVVVCYESAKEAIERARSESLPTLLEYKTYRYRGHSMADPGKYRAKDEISRWKEKDPLNLAEQRIVQDFPELADRIDDIRQGIEAEISEAIQFAESSATPNSASVADHTYYQAGLV